MSGPWLRGEWVVHDGLAAIEAAIESGAYGALAGWAGAWGSGDLSVEFAVLEVDFIDSVDEVFVGEVEFFADEGPDGFGDQEHSIQSSISLLGGVASS